MKIKNQLTRFLLVLLTMVFALSCGQSPDTKSQEEHEHTDGMDHNVAGIDSAGKSNKDDEQERVKAVLRAYKSALENLNVEGTGKLFTSQSEILETGKVEGTYQDYIAHHIGPELGHFKSFTYNDYKVSVIVDGDYAFSTETYNYVIVLKEGDKTIERQGAATSVLHKEDGQWKIMKAHNSSRAPKKK